jgi:hypothetical protein
MKNGLMCREEGTTRSQHLFFILPKIFGDDFLYRKTKDWTTRRPPWKHPFSQGGSYIHGVHTDGTHTPPLFRFPGHTGG